MGDTLQEIMDDWRNGSIDDDEAIAHIEMGAEDGEIDGDLAEDLIEFIGE
jgi:hypothetical protein